MNDYRYQALSRLLDDIEQEMTGLGLWHTQPPPAQAFNSSAPFFADSMAFEHWLQWVLIARFRALIDGQLPLPARCHITPMAEETLAVGQHNVHTLLALLQQLDQLFDDDSTSGG